MNLARFKSIVILTGAGISAESGIRTFRDADGLWEGHHIEEVATPQGFLKNPSLVHTFYNERRAQLQMPNIQPNAAHHALAKLEAEWEGEFLLVTQNVDNLHEKAGSEKLIHMHGSLLKTLCTNCESSQSWSEDVTDLSTCRKCGEAGRLRPDIVWFGEMPYQLDAIFAALNECQLFVAIGTSGNVHPAASFSRDAWKARKIEVNLVTTGTGIFDERWQGPASIEVPKLVKELLN